MMKIKFHDEKYTSVTRTLYSKWQLTNAEGINAWKLCKPSIFGFAAKKLHYDLSKLDHVITW